MDRWQAMNVFVKVAETSSFAEAARHLKISAPVVTRVVAALEAAIGSRLLHRTTRTVKLTEVGARYLDDCRRILAEIVEAENAASGSYAKPTGMLSVSASVLFGPAHVLPIIQRYLDEFPATSARTLFVDRMVNMIEEDVDVAIRIGHLDDSGLVAIRVGATRRVLCGSPEYFERHGVPEAPSDLKRHRIVASTSAWTSSEWRFGGNRRVVLEPALRCNTNDAAIVAAKSGWGLTRVLHYQIGDALDAGDLRVVLDDCEEAPLPIHVLYPGGRHVPAKVRAFVDLAVPQLRATPILN